MSNKNGHEIETQKFYTKNKKAYLVVENKFQFSKITVVLNGQELRLEVIPTIFKPERFDISEYMVEGENKITYMLPYSEMHKKPVKLYVEIKEAKHE